MIKDRVFAGLLNTAVSVSGCFLLAKTVPIRPTTIAATKPLPINYVVDDEVDASHRRDVLDLWFPRTAETTVSARRPARILTKAASGMRLTATGARC
jgi:hypothetical protein